MIAAWALLMRFARRWAVPGALAVAAVVIALDPREAAAPLELAPELDLHRARARRGRAARARPAAVRGHDGLAERPRHRRAGQLRLPPADAPGAGRAPARRPWSARRSARTRSTWPRSRRARRRAGRHPDPARRWIASVAGGVGYLVLGLAAGAGGGAGRRSRRRC